MKFVVKCSLSALALSVTLLGTAHAEPGGSEFPRFFEVVKATGAARSRIRAIAVKCSVSDDERTGPSDAEQRRCASAQAALIALGPSAVPAILSAIDEPRLGDEAREALYASVGRIGGFTAIEPLLRAIDRLGESASEDRQWELRSIESALRLVTFASIGETSPGVAATNRTPDKAARQWRTWLAKHPKLDADALLAERIEQDRPHLHDADFWDAFAYAEFFSDHALSRQEGIAALHELKARPGLDEEQDQSLRDALRSAERAAKKDARTKPGKPLPAAPPASGLNS